MQILIMSDIHGNEQALSAVLKQAADRADEIILLGDLIDYGMHSNQVIERIQSWKIPLICNIYGNHEAAVMQEDYSRFSSKRGEACARYTRAHLTEASMTYLTTKMDLSGKKEFWAGDKKCLAVHGSLADIYWKSIKPGENAAAYQEYDYVFSGHSHLPHFFEVFYDVDAPETRNKKKTVFVNPGSVGQPRNLNPMAQYVMWDTKTDKMTFEKASYNIGKEQEAYDGSVDDFYRMRLERGI